MHRTARTLPGLRRPDVLVKPLGDRRCLVCDPPKTALRLLEKAKAIRRRHGFSSPAGAVEMLAGIKQLIDTCIETK